MTDHTNAATGLVRTVGSLGLTASVIKLIIGSSIFVFPAVVASELGSAGILPYLVAAPAMGLIALCFCDERQSTPSTPIGAAPRSRSS